MGSRLERSGRRGRDLNCAVLPEPPGPGKNASPAKWDARHRRGTFYFVIGFLPGYSDEVNAVISRRQIEGGRDPYPSVPTLIKEGMRYPTMIQSERVISEGRKTRNHDGERRGACDDPFEGAPSPGVFQRARRCVRVGGIFIRPAHPQLQGT